MFLNDRLKGLIFPVNQSTLTIDGPLCSIIRHKIIIFIIDQLALNGSYNQNANHLNHNNIYNIKVDVNGSSLYNYNSECYWKK